MGTEEEAMESAVVGEVRTVTLDLDELLFYIEELAADEAVRCGAGTPYNPFNMAARLRRYLLDQT